jgi:Secretion system C-terminal sorting domain
MQHNYKSLITCLALLPVAFIANAQGIINNGANIIIQSGSNLIVTNGGYTNGSNGLINNEGTIKVDGNWTNNAANAVFASPNGTGLVEFNGASAQTIGGTNGTGFETLLLSGAGIKSCGVNDNSVRNTLTLDGILNLNGYKFIVENSATNAIVQNAPISSKHIRSESTNGNARLQWNIGNAGNGSNYRFPFGNAAGHDVAFTFQVTSAGAQSGTGNITVATYPTAADNTPWANTVSAMNFEDGGSGVQASADRWWVVDANNYSTKPTSTMVFKYSDNDINIANNPILVEDSLKAQRWDANLVVPSGVGGWNPPDFFAGTNTANTAANTVTVSGVTNYSPWVLHDGSSGSNSPLPVSLVDFKGACSNGNVVLTWVTATEVNNDYFEIQRSVDGANYTTVGIVDGAGTSNTMLSYSFIDDSPSAAGAYYRLNQVDFNLENETFAPKYISCGDVPANSIGLYPNPADNLVNVSINLANADRGAILIYNAVGQLIANDVVNLGVGSNNLPVNTAGLAQGHYFLHIQLQNAQLPVQKLVITR